MKKILKLEVLIPFWHLMIRVRLNFNSRFNLVPGLEQSSCPTSKLSQNYSLIFIDF